MLRPSGHGYNNPANTTPYLLAKTRGLERNHITILHKQRRL